jgi:hypothetical protein
MPRREPPRHLRAVCPATCCAATAKPNELCSRSPSRRVVLLQVSSRWRPVDSLVPVYPATPLRGHKTTVRRDWHPDPLADLPTATARRRGAPVTPAKHHFATEPLLLVHWKSALIPEWNRQFGVRRTDHYGSTGLHGRIRNGTPITEPAAATNQRSECGHWKWVLPGFLWAGRSLQLHQQRQFCRSSTPAIGRQLLRATDGWLRRRQKTRHFEQMHLINVVEPRG